MVTGLGGLKPTHFIGHSFWTFWLAPEPDFILLFVAWISGAELMLTSLPELLEDKSQEKNKQSGDGSNVLE